ncbi:MAG: phosphoadenosine phosphosulfate reductase family protein [Candidatus Limiplasma sp.]|nr:phosphoadenosine phosphosulfate reductase family protein [Candidatus Limiplasma sp.]
MALRMTEEEFAALQARNRRRSTFSIEQKEIPTKRSKYGNRRVEVDGIKFDSQHEATIYQELMLRVQAGELKAVLRQVNPIIDWTDSDVWEFIKAYHVPYCSLYDEGCKRLGCIGCPLGGYAAQKKEFERWPVYRKLYIRAFDDMLTARKRSGKNNRHSLWKDGEGVFRWWTGEGKTNDPNQMTFDEFL